MYRLLIVEDDEGIAGSIAQRCTSWDYDVHCVQNFKEVLQEFISYRPHLVYWILHFLFMMVSTGVMRYVKFPKPQLCLSLLQQKE